MGVKGICIALAIWPQETLEAAAKVESKTETRGWRA